MAHFSAGQLPAFNHPVLVQPAEAKSSVGHAMHAVNKPLALEKNVRHKDLKPNNVLVLENRVLISDFGLAKEFENNNSGTMDNTGLVFATYMPPERMAGKERNRRTDIFPLACIFLDIYAVMSGRIPEDREQLIGSIFCQNLPKIQQWLGYLTKERAASETDFQEKLREMFSEEKEDRPRAVEVWQSAVACSTGSGVRFCRDCCLNFDVNDSN